VLSEFPVVFNVLDDHVSHRVAEAQFGFKKRHHIFAIIRIHPHAVLKAIEPERLHRVSQTLSHGGYFLGDVEDDNPPSLVPSSPCLAEHAKLVLKHEELTLAGFGEFRASLSLHVRKSNVALHRHVREHALCSVVETVFILGQVAQQLKRVGGCHADKEQARDAHRRKERIPHLPPSSADARFFLHLSHIP